MLKTSQDPKVIEYMSPTPATVRSGDTIKSMLQTLQQNKVSALPVLDSMNHCVGIVSLADIARRAFETEELLENHYPHFEDCLWAVELIQRRFGNDPITTLMTEVIVTVSPDTSLREAASKMLDNRIHHLPVILNHGTLVGMLSAIDFVRFASCQSSVFHHNDSE